MRSPNTKNHILQDINMETALEITVNSESKVVAGIEEISVLSFILSYISGEKDSLDLIELSVGGLLHHGQNDYEHLDWIKRNLEIGDEITIRVIESCDLTTPVSRRREDPKLVEKAQRKYYESLKKYEGT